jgi:hypothetical protein
MLRADPLAQVDYARVVDLDIGASKSDICVIRAATISKRALAELEPAITGFVQFDQRVQLSVVAFISLS